jgi:hypothetical protein
MVKVDTNNPSGRYPEYKLWDTKADKDIPLEIAVGKLVKKLITAAPSIAAVSSSQQILYSTCTRACMPVPILWLTCTHEAHSPCLPNSYCSSTTAKRRRPPVPASAAEAPRPSSRQTTAARTRRGSRAPPPLLPLRRTAGPDVRWARIRTATRPMPCRRTRRTERGLGASGRVGGKELVSGLVSTHRSDGCECGGSEKEGGFDRESWTHPQTCAWVMCVSGTCHCQALKQKSCVPHSQEAVSKGSADMSLRWEVQKMSI